jgi:hypothetical protein
VIAIMASPLDANNLFNVNGQVIVITSGGSGEWCSSSHKKTSNYLKK